MSSGLLPKAELLNAVGTSHLGQKRSSALMDRSNGCSISSRGVVTSYKAIVSARGSPDLMQASPTPTISAISIAHEMLKMQNDPLQVIEIDSEGVESFRLGASVEDRVTNLGRKTIDVLEVVAILAASKGATFRERLTTS
jgi:hypothetical protein